MKLEINTETKTITVLEPVKLGEFAAFMDITFPNMGWQEYTLICKEVTVYNPWIYPWTYPYTPPANSYPVWVGDPSPNYPTICSAGTSLNNSCCSTTANTTKHD